MKLKIHLPKFCSAKLRQVKNYKIKNWKSGFTHQNFPKENLGGFTMIEALVAISILLIGILSVFTLVTKSLATAPVIQDRLVASFLAQEKLEEIRQIRDSNFLKILNTGEGDWKDEIESLNNTVDSDTLNNTTFTRKVAVSSKGDDHLQIQCTISWTTKGHPYHFTAEDHLFNWINI